MGAAAVLLSSCLPPAIDDGPRASDAVDFDHIKDATVRIYAEGTFIEPGTLDPYEGGWYGSGFIVDPSGLIVTNYHVAGGAESMVVWIGDDNDDGDEIDAEIVGYSECLDLAVIQLDDGDEDYPFMAWHEGDITEGLDVYSAGFPGGDPNFTLTKGIVSKSDFEREFSWSSLQHVIEHDARIRGGNSGGPLIDEEGRVVGVNYAGDDGTNDYNWAIHRDEVLDVIDDLEDGDAVLSLGLSGSALYPDDGDESGVWVQSVQADGPAEDIGIEPGDILLTMDGDDLATEGTMEEYCGIIDDEGTDGEIDVEVYRPSEDAYYEGQFNGDDLEFVSGGNGGSVIEGFSLVTDDEGVLEVSIPEEWDDVEGSILTDDDGVKYNAITAAPDIDGFYNSWDTPGVQVLSSEAKVDADIDTELVDYLGSIPDDCTLDDEGEFDDGLYAGQYKYFTDCGGAGTDFAAVVGKDYDGTHLIYLAVQMVSSSDKSTVLDEILDTFLARY
jgi:serine protease Do